jgi:(p)ppGpp synthase/HD superfamily hydrolase
MSAATPTAMRGRNAPFGDRRCHRIGGVVEAVGEVERQRKSLRTSVQAPSIDASVTAALTSSRAGRPEAIAFLIDAYEGVGVRPGKGLPHAQAVADVLRRAGYDESAQVLALLHDVVEDTPRTIDEVRDAFGEPMADMVGALTEDTTIRRYTQRKLDLRSRSLAAGSPVVDVALADKIASLRHAVITHTKVGDRTLRHYTVTLQLALTASLAPGLCKQLDELIAQVAPVSA